VYRRLAKRVAINTSLFLILIESAGAAIIKILRARDRGAHQATDRARSSASDRVRPAVHRRADYMERSGHAVRNAPALTRVSPDWPRGFSTPQGGRSDLRSRFPSGLSELQAHMVLTLLPSERKARPFKSFFERKRPAGRNGRLRMCGAGGREFQVG